MQKAIAQAKPFCRAWTEQAYAAWRCLNNHLFDGALQTPYIIVDRFSQNWLGAQLPYYAEDGCRSMILIDSVYVADCLLSEKFAIARAILLHEMCHQFLYELNGQNCGRDGAHSDAFAKTCNAVWAKSGRWERVKSHRTWKRKRRGVSAQSWPFCFLHEVSTEIRRIQRENQKPFAPPAIDSRRLVDAARRIEAHLIGSPVVDDYERILDALGIRPEREAVQAVLNRGGAQCVRAR